MSKHFTAADQGRRAKPLDGASWGILRLDPRSATIQMMKTGFRTILVVDDDERCLRSLARAFQSRPQVLTTQDPDTALRLASVANPDLALIDLYLDLNRNGIDLIRRLRPAHSEMTILLMSGYLSPRAAVAAVDAGADNFVEKPVDATTILKIAAAGAKGRSQGTIELPALWEMQDDYVRRVLADCNGNITKAAAVLGVLRQSLQRMLREMRLRSSNPQR